MSKPDKRPRRCYVEDMDTPGSLLTAEEFETLADLPEGRKVALIDGEVVVMSPVSLDHGDISLGIGSSLRVFVNLHGLG